MSHKIFGVDFGTDTLKIYQKGKGIIWDQKEIVALTYKQKDYTRKVKVPIAVGDEAYEMYGRAPENIIVTYPVKHGVVANIEDMFCLWQGVCDKLNTKKIFKGGIFYLAVPAQATDVEKRAFYDLIMQSGIKAKDARILDKPIADAFGAQIDVLAEKGSMVVDIGADTTEISILSLGGIVVNRMLPIGCQTVTDNIIRYVKNTYKFVIGAKSAEYIRQNLISAFTTDGTLDVVGLSVVKGLPDTLTLKSEELFPLTEEFYSKIVLNAKMTLERTPPEIYSSVSKNGVYLTGGGANIKGMDELFEQELEIPVVCKDNPQHSVILGLKAMIESPKLTQYMENRLK